MAHEAEVEPHKSSPQRTGAPIIWWALVGAWLGLFALDSALTGGGVGPSGSWMQLSIALILLGPFLPSLFFDADGQEFSPKGMWTAARRHWSGVVGIFLLLSGVGLMVANLVLEPETVRPSDWAFAVVFLLMPLISIFGITGPRVRFRFGALIAIGVVAAVLIGGSFLYGSRLQWAYAQLNFLLLGGIAVLALLAFGVLRLMDWMIARSERSANHR
ncbi:MAG: hypothetical protein R3C30_04690 [Hyphomonadaceae bacterium]